jgi:hypothetical protein
MMCVSAPQLPSPRSYGERVASECEPGEGLFIHREADGPPHPICFASLANRPLPASGER